MVNLFRLPTLQVSLYQDSDILKLYQKIHDMVNSNSNLSVQTNSDSSFYELLHRNPIFQTQRPKSFIDIFKNSHRCIPGNIFSNNLRTILGRFLDCLTDNFDLETGILEKVI